MGLKNRLYIMTFSLELQMGIWRVAILLTRQQRLGACHMTTVPKQRYAWRLTVGIVEGGRPRDCCIYTHFIAFLRVADSLLPQATWE